MAHARIPGGARRGARGQQGGDRELTLAPPTCVDYKFLLPGGWGRRLSWKTRNRQSCGITMSTKSSMVLGYWDIRGVSAVSASGRSPPAGRRPGPGVSSQGRGSASSRASPDGRAGGQRPLPRGTAQEAWAWPPGLLGAPLPRLLHLWARRGEAERGRALGPLNDRPERDAGSGQPWAGGRWRAGVGSRWPPRRRRPRAFSPPQLAHAIRLLLEFTDSRYEEKRYTCGEGKVS